MSSLILIADDDPVVRMILGSVLGANGFSVAQVESGAECIDEVLKRSSDGELPSALFLDYQLPDMSGVEVIAAVRGICKSTKLPIIMLSANAQEEVSGTFKENAPELYLQKPFVAQTILDALKTVGVG